ncbi:hypothetical protein Mapa_002605 [Marchantia paleacea]|nr:hypothetical protein Mapa_002605 [Marchantia paleacea]
MYVTVPTSSYWFACARALAAAIKKFVSLLRYSRHSISASVRISLFLAGGGLRKPAFGPNPYARPGILPLPAMFIIMRTYASLNLASKVMGDRILILILGILKRHDLLPILSVFTFTGLPFPPRLLIRSYGVFNRPFFTLFQLSGITPVKPSMVASRSGPL